MSKRFLYMAFLTCLTGCAIMLPARGHAQSAASSADQAHAEIAYDDLLKNYWVGSANDGHFTTIMNQAPASALKRYDLWKFQVGVGTLYARWKASNSNDARNRMKAMWRYEKANWSLADVSACGVGTTSTAEDDATWDAGGFIQLWEASGDNAAMAYAKAALDCAFNRWSDKAGSDALFYDDTRTIKSSYQAPYAYISLEYYLYSHNDNYLKRAQAIEKWAQTALKRSDGLYWADALPGGLYKGDNRPNDINTAGSVSFLAGNMAFAALDAHLYSLTGDPSYKQRAIATATGIKLKEVDKNNVLIDDRDAWTNGWAAPYYVQNVLPILPPTGTADASTILATARSVSLKDRGDDGSYGGDWQGPLFGKWQHIGSSNSQLMTNATATVWVILAAGLTQ